MLLTVASMLTLSFTASTDEPSADGAPCKGCAPCGVPGGYCTNPEQSCCGGINIGKCYTIGYSQCCGTSIGGTLCGLTDTCCSLGGGATQCCSPDQACNFGSCSPSPPSDIFGEVDAPQSPRADDPKSPQVEAPKLPLAEEPQVDTLPEGYAEAEHEAIFGPPPCPSCVVCGVPSGYCKPEQSCCGGGALGTGKCFEDGGGEQCCQISAPVKLCNVLLGETCCSLGAGTTECCKPNQQCSFGSCIPP